MLTETQTNGALALEQKDRVIIIPAQDEITARKLRVAAYARVSSSSEDQLNSYRAQNQYYSELISNNPDWEMVDIYADSGITGTSVDKREDFKRMMADCRKGKIDRILVKSISRFARNTKDCLAAVRELKELGVSVLFEEQGIDTARVSSEMVTAIMASLAQKQSPPAGPSIIFFTLEIAALFKLAQIAPDGRFAERTLAGRLQRVCKISRPDRYPGIGHGPEQDIFHFRVFFLHGGSPSHSFVVIIFHPEGKVHQLFQIWPTFIR